MCHKAKVIAFAILLSLLATGADVVAWEVAAEAQFNAEQIEFFETEVRPILVAHCYQCHSTDAKQLKAELYVDSREGMLVGGESGPVVIAGHPEQSRLVSAVRYEAAEMPPDKQLNDRQIAAIEKWVTIGAPWPRVDSAPAQQSAAPRQAINWQAERERHWAWQPPRKTAVPGDVVRAGDGTLHENVIDRFVDCASRGSSDRAESFSEASSSGPAHFLGLSRNCPNS